MPQMPPRPGAWGERGQGTVANRCRINNRTRTVPSGSGSRVTTTVYRVIRHAGGRTEIPLSTHVFGQAAWRGGAAAPSRVSGGP